MAKSKFKRPIRIWNEVERRNERWRCYTTPEAALNRAVVLMREKTAVGHSLTVYDLNGAKWLGTFTRRVHDIHFDKPRRNYVD